MVKKIRRNIKNNRIIGPMFVVIYRFMISIFTIPKQIKLYYKTKNSIMSVTERKRVYYMGIPAHNNLGDLAQGMCIRRWLKRYYSDREIIEIETNALVNTKFSVLKYLKKVFKKGDIIVFQSGYTTTDLGGYADEMHCAVIKLLPQAKMLMMPQTIFFQSAERKKNTSNIYNRAKNMLFLARDRVSFDMAREMFPGIQVLMYPDIVTTLIGEYQYINDRNGILFCCRDDSEKYYSEKEIMELMHSCMKFAGVERTDTTKNIRFSNIVENAEQYICSEIKKYSKYKVIITDRYHGTIFSLIAGTPVIILKTTDHKVVTGTEWFKGIYDDYVYLADSLDSAREIAERLYFEKRSYMMKPYFEKEYYGKLKDVFEKLEVNGGSQQ